MRRTRCPPVFAQLKDWCKEQQAVQLPESKAREAGANTLNQWDSLTRNIGNPKVPIGNNMSERILRIIALGRATYLFEGNARHRLAVAGHLHGGLRWPADPEAGSVLFRPFFGLSYHFGW